MLDQLDRLVIALTKPVLGAAVVAVALAVGSHAFHPVPWIEALAGLLFLAAAYLGAYLALRRDGLMLVVVYEGRIPRWAERALAAAGGFILFVYFLGFVAHADRSARAVWRAPLAAFDQAAEVLLLVLPPTVLAMAASLAVSLIRRRRG